MVLDTQKLGCDNLFKIILDSDCYVVILGWQGDRIIGAINGSINNFEGPDGDSAPPMFPSDRTVC